MNLKKQVLGLCFVFGLGCLFAQNHIFALKSKEKTVFCIQFDTGISVFLDIPVELEGYSDMGSSFLLSTKKNEVVIIGRVAQKDFLSKKQRKELSEADKLKAYFLWEKKFQEENNNNIFKEDLQIIENEDRTNGYYRFYSNVPQEQLKDTDTVATEGVMFVFDDYIIYVNKFLFKTQDSKESTELLYTFYRSMKVVKKLFKPEEGWDIYSSL